MMDCTSRLGQEKARPRQHQSRMEEHKGRQHRVTRDLRRTEFKERLTRKDRLNELLAETNTILTTILEELKKQT